MLNYKITQDSIYKCPRDIQGFDAFIDYPSKAQYITSNYVNENGIFVMAAEKKVDNLDQQVSLEQHYNQMSSPKRQNIYRSQ